MDIPDNQRQIMGSQLRVRLRRIRITIPSTRDNRAHGDPTHQALLLQCQLAETRQLIPQCRAIDQAILQNITPQQGRSMIKRRLNLLSILALLQLVGVLPLVEDEAWVVVPFVKVLEDRAEDLGGLVGKGYAFVGGRGGGGTGSAGRVGADG